MTTVSTPRKVKAHGKVVADEYLRLGWTLEHEFRETPDSQPYEYYFEWQRPGEPVLIDWTKFREHTDAA